MLISFHCYKQQNLICKQGKYLLSAGTETRFLKISYRLQIKQKNDMVEKGLQWGVRYIVSETQKEKKMVGFQPPNKKIQNQPSIHDRTKNIKRKEYKSKKKTKYLSGI